MQPGASWAAPEVVACRAVSRHAMRSRAGLVSGGGLLASVACALLATCHRALQGRSACSHEMILQADGAGASCCGERGFNEMKLALACRGVAEQTRLLLDPIAYCKRL